MRADDRWVMIGTTAPCGPLIWQADALFLNTSDQPATIKLLGLSDGADTVTNREVVLPPMHVTSYVLSVRWGPTPTPSSPGGPVFFAHLDVPSSVEVEGKLNVGSMLDCLPTTPNPNLLAIYGAARLPTFRSLTPAAQARTFLGVDLGELASRTNVGIYNAGTIDATASIELRHGRDNRVLLSKLVRIPANSTVQVPLGSQPPFISLDNGAVQEWVTYLVVTVDQPSLTFVSTLEDGAAPRVTLVTR